jgi:hypothetical protein
MYAALIIIAFFVPAYGSTSAFRFFISAIDSVGSDSEITLMDIFIVLLPLLLVPLAAAIILFRAIRRMAPNSLLLGLPFFSIAFFFLILSFDVTRQVNNGNVFRLLKQMSVGFYIAILASLLLLMSYSRREALNLSSGRK